MPNSVLYGIVFLSIILLNLLFVLLKSIGDFYSEYKEDKESNLRKLN